MQSKRICGVVFGALLLFCGLPAVSQQFANEHDSTAASWPASDAPLPVEQVVRNLEKRNAQRAAALKGFSSRRVYHMQYRGFPSDRYAEMVVDVIFRAPNVKQFRVVSQSGSNFVIEHIFKRLLESEQQDVDEENRQHTALNRENYDFTFAGYEVTANGAQYVLNLLPKNKNKFLYQGKIWIDAKDFAVVRIEGEPARNPSLWIKTTEIKHRYVDVNGFWLPAENHTESVIRFGGHATLSIEYKDYKITRVAPLLSIESAKTYSK